jgi:hypothetical protein
MKTAARNVMSFLFDGNALLSLIKCWFFLMFMPGVLLMAVAFWVAVFKEIW